MFVYLTFLVLITVDQTISWRLSDLLVASSEPVAYNNGGGREHESEHHASKGEKDVKGYAGYHDFEKGAKGHHDKERHSGHYADEAGHTGGYNDGGGYYSNFHKGNGGKNGYQYKDQGSYVKGHSIRGAHTVHKLDEFKKNTDFFDEDHDEDFKEKHGGYEQAVAYNTGDSRKGGYFRDAFLNGLYGKGGKFEKGSHHFDNKGHNNAVGYDGHFARGDSFKKEGGNNGHKKWGYNQYY